MRQLSGGQCQPRRRGRRVVVIAAAAGALALCVPLAAQAGAASRAAAPGATTRDAYFQTRLPDAQESAIAAFGPQLYGTKSASQQVTISNNGTDWLYITAVTATANFTASSGCNGAAVAIGASCSFNVTFAPKAYGPLTGTLKITSNTPGGPQTIALAGTGLAPAATTVTLPVSAGVESYATLNGEVLSQGPGTFYFEYGTSSAYGEQTPPVPLASSSTSQLFEVTVPVDPGTTYHYRIVSTNLAGTVDGGDQAFATPPNPPVLSSAVGHASLPEVLDGGLKLTLDQSSIATVGLRISVSAQTAHAAHLISRSRTSTAPVVIGAATIAVAGAAPVDVTVPIRSSDQRLLATLKTVTFTVDADAVSGAGVAGSPTEISLTVAH